MYTFCILRIGFGSKKKTHVEYRKCCYHLSPGRATEMSEEEKRKRWGAAQINSTVLGQSLDSFLMTAPNGQNLPGMISKRGKDYFYLSGD